MDEVDAVVVGAGHNGLICAAYLARAGMRPLVLEARSVIGGCAATVDALGARVNVCNCDHLLIQTTPIVDELALADHGLDYLEVRPSLVGLGYEGEAWLVHHDPEHTLEGLARTHPGSVAGYRRYLDAALPAARLVFDVAHRVPTLRTAAAVTAARRGRGVGTLLRWSRASALEVLRAFDLDDDLVATALVIGPGLWGASPAAPGTGLGALALATRHVARTRRPRGGSGGLPAALHSALTAHGGRIRCGASVARLLVGGGRVRGVELTDGEVIPTSTVVASTAPNLPLGEWIDGEAVSARHRRRWSRLPRPQGFQSKIDAIIEGRPTLPRLEAHPQHGPGLDPLAATVASAPPPDGLVLAHARWKAGRVPDRPAILTNVPSVLDPEMRTVGGDHVLSIEVLGTPYQLAWGWPSSDEPDRWLRVWGGLTDGDTVGRVRARRVVLPPDLETELTLPNGFPSAFGGSPLDAVRGRPRELTRYVTPIVGLYVGGAGAFPGAGIWGAAGRNVAQVVLARA
jgi:phytoene dehydrogenase-like protein